MLRSRGALAAIPSGPSERLFRSRYRLGAEINFGGSAAVLGVDIKTDRKARARISARDLYARTVLNCSSLYCIELLATTHTRGCGNKLRRRRGRAGSQHQDRQKGIILLCYTALHCSALYCTVLHCIAFG